MPIITTAKKYIINQLFIRIELSFVKIPIAVKLFSNLSSFKKYIITETKIRKNKKTKI